MPSYIFIDVNGTIVPDGAVGFELSQSSLDAFSKMYEKLRSNNVRVGLCSDSPLKQLRSVGSVMGLEETSPIFAENGNIYFDGEDAIVVRSLSQRVRNDVLSIVQDVAKSMKLTQVDDIVAPEFSNWCIDYDRQWGFGADRSTSVSVFGQPELIHVAGLEIKRTCLTNSPSISVDCVPETNYLGIHPIDDYRVAKKQSLYWLFNQLSILDGCIESMWLVGDSPSDIVDGIDERIKSYFVATEKLSKQQLADATFVSSESHFDGVIDCLTVIEDELNLFRRDFLSG